MRRSAVSVSAIVALVLAWLAGFSHAAEAPAAKGSLVIIGGALRPDNAAVWERIVQLAGGKGARIAVFASASANPKNPAPAWSIASTNTAPTPFSCRSRCA